jgi:hypothetical protein
MAALLPLLLVTSFSTFADEPTTAPAGDTQPVIGELSAERIDELAQQLDHTSFAQRQAATKELEKGGKQAIPALETAAMGTSREKTTRSIDLLKKFFETGDETTKAAAKEALTRLSSCNRPSAASRAQAALHPKPPVEQIPWQLPGGGVAQIQVQVQMIGGKGFKRMSMKNVNGVKDIEVEERDRKLKIHEEPTGKIEVEVTEKKDGKQTTSKYQADSADELKKKHPEAHKIYEQYGKGNGGAGIQIHGIQIQGGGQLPMRIEPKPVKQKEAERPPEDPGKEPAKPQAP